MTKNDDEFKPSWYGNKSLGEESRWEIFKFLMGIGNYGAAISVWFWKRDKNGNWK